MKDLGDVPGVRPRDQRVAWHGRLDSGIVES